MIVHKNGKPLCVLRPQDPEKALADAKALLGEKGSTAKEAFQNILMTQPYTFMGYLGDDRDIVDPSTGHVIGKVQPGDSFATVKG